MLAAFVGLQILEVAGVRDLVEFTPRSDRSLYRDCSPRADGST